MDTFVGIDLTAGTADTRFDEGPLPFPAVVLGRSTGLAIHTVEPFTSLIALRDWVRQLDPTGIAIDGPCGARGLALDPGRTHFVFDDPKTRESERALARLGIGLFWTTRATVESFDGAARWIARSLVLFEDLIADGRDPVETHPHGVFTILHREEGRTDKLPLKTKPAGRARRLELLGQHVSLPDPTVLPDDDHVDAAAAALLAAMRADGNAHPHGDSETGGAIWLPHTRSKSSAST